jgi:hypothetical protein
MSELKAKSSSLDCPAAAVDTSHHRTIRKHEKIVCPRGGCEREESVGALHLQELGN